MKWEITTSNNGKELRGCSKILIGIQLVHHSTSGEGISRGILYSPKTGIGKVMSKDFFTQKEFKGNTYFQETATNKILPQTGIAIAIHKTVMSVSKDGTTGAKSCPWTCSSRMTDLSYLAFNFVSTIAVTFINKICFSRVEFGYPAALCNIHFLVTLIGVELLYRANMFQKVQVNLKDPNFIAIAFVVGVVTPLNNTSLKLNSIGFYQIFKLLVTPCVVLLEYILDRKTLSRNRTVLLFLVCVFVMVSSTSALVYSHYGTICALIWVPFAALYKVQWGRVKTMYQCSTLALMRAVLPYAICVQAAISPIVDPPGILDFVWTQEAVFWIGLSGIFAFLVNFSGFLVMGNIR